jgi:hypothetical protein
MGKKSVIGGIFRMEGEAYKKAYRATPGQAKVLRAIGACRTERMGTHTVVCGHCGHRERRHNSCRDRHCPVCQGAKQAQWAERLKGQLLPCRYFHLVFTLPDSLNGIVYGNQEMMYGILMQSAARALLKVAASPRFLGASTGCLCVLHTWGQNLLFHPHVHMLVPAGGLGPDGWEWVPSRRKFFVPVRVLSKVFRGIFMSMLREARDKGQVQAGNVPLGQLYAKDWNVYCKKAFGGPGQVVSYLARYTHRVAISDSRILSYGNGKVRFKWKDYRQKGSRYKAMELDSLEFIRRFLLHVLPCNFYKIRYAGIFANKSRGPALERCRYLLARLQGYSLEMGMGKKTVERCPACRVGILSLLSMAASPET